MPSGNRNTPEPLLPPLTRRAFMAASAFAAAAAAALALLGCAAEGGEKHGDGGAFFDDGTGFVA